MRYKWYKSTSSYQIKHIPHTHMSPWSPLLWREHGISGLPFSSSPTTHKQEHIIHTPSHSRPFTPYHISTIRPSTTSIQQGQKQRTKYLLHTHTCKPRRGRLLARLSEFLDKGDPELGDRKGHVNYSSVLPYSLYCPCPLLFITLFFFLFSLLNFFLPYSLQLSASSFTLLFILPHLSPALISSSAGREKRSRVLSYPSLCSLPLPFFLRCLLVGLFLALVSSPLAFFPLVK